VAVTYFSDRKKLSTMPGGVYQGSTGPGSGPKTLYQAPGVPAPIPKQKRMSGAELANLQTVLRVGMGGGPTLPPKMTLPGSNTAVNQPLGGGMNRFNTLGTGGGGMPAPGIYNQSGGEWWRPLLDAGVNWAAGAIGGQGQGGSLAENPCGQGYEFRNGRCEKTGLGGAAERFLPGGETGYYGADFTPTSAFGMAGFVPQAMQTQRLVCPKGYVLFGKEPGMEVCLHKGAMPNKLRKWPKGARPVMTAQDAKTLRRAKALQNKVKRIATGAGFACRKK